MRERPATLRCLLRCLTSGGHAGLTLVDLRSVGALACSIAGAGLRPRRRGHVAKVAVAPVSRVDITRRLLRGAADVVVLVGALGGRARRMALGALARWREVAHTAADARRPAWSVFARRRSCPQRSPPSEAHGVRCVAGGSSEPIWSLHWAPGACDLCSIGPDDTSAVPSSGGRGLSEPTWDCLRVIRERLTCKQLRDGDMHGVDWLRFREDLRLAVLAQRQGVPLAFKQGLFLRLHRLVFEAANSEIALDTSRPGWEGRLRRLLSEHLAFGRHGCLVGHVALQVFVAFFVDRRQHGLWQWEQSSLPAGAQAGMLDRVAESVDAPLCFSSGGAWVRQDILGARVRVLQAMRWMLILDSGWPIFKSMTLLVHDECWRGRRLCRPRCPDDIVLAIGTLVEERVAALFQHRGHVTDRVLRTLAMDIWAEHATAPHVSSCGDLWVVVSAVSCAVALARTGHLEEASYFVTMAELHFTDLTTNVACALDEALISPQIWEILGFVEDEFHARSPHGFGRQCALSLCPEGGSPNLVTCECDSLRRNSPRPVRRDPPRATSASVRGVPRQLHPRSVCIISADPGSDRPLDGNLSRLVTGRVEEVSDFWTLTYHLNRMYAALHGYRFYRPTWSDAETRRLLDDGSWPQRRLQWAIVRLVQRMLEDRSCRYVAWLDSDAFVVSSEPLDVILEASGFFRPHGPSRQQRLFLFASAVSAEKRHKDVSALNISDHFLVVRNTPLARHMVERWWRLPSDRPELARFRTELFLEQTAMNEYFPRLRNLVARAPPLGHFEGFAGRFVRHGGGIKDLDFRLRLQSALLARVLAPKRALGSAWAAAMSRDNTSQELLKLAMASTM